MVIQLEAELKAAFITLVLLNIHVTSHQDRLLKHTFVIITVKELIIRQLIEELIILKDIRSCALGCKQGAFTFIIY